MCVSLCVSLCAFEYRSCTKTMQCTTWRGHTCRSPSTLPSHWTTSPLRTAPRGSSPTARTGRGKSTSASATLQRCLRAARRGVSSPGQARRGTGEARTGRTAHDWHSTFTTVYRGSSHKSRKVCVCVTARVCACLCARVTAHVAVCVAVCTVLGVDARAALSFSAQFQELLGYSGSVDFRAPMDVVADREAGRTQPWVHPHAATPGETFSFPSQSLLQN